MKKNVWIGFQSPDPDRQEWWFDVGQGTVFDGEWKEFTQIIVKENEILELVSNQGAVSLKIGGQNLGQIFKLDWGNPT